MSAIEIIAELKKLPRSEQEQVMAFLQNARGERKETGEPDVRYVADTDFDKTADKMLQDHAGLFRRLAQ